MVRRVDVILPMIPLVSNLIFKAAYLFFCTTKDNEVRRHSYLISDIRE